MKIHRELEQGSLAWLEARLGIPTASEFGNLVTPKGKVRTGDMVQSYLAQKTAEWWLNRPLQDINPFAMEQGHLLEDEAIPFLALERDIEIETVGFITDDAGIIGCSPDGWLDKEGIGVEVKCPQPAAHFSYLLGGVLPEKYVAQVQGSMYVAGAKEWLFLSYCRQAPKLILRIKRDEDYQESLKMALDDFLAQLQQAKHDIEVMNGGPPKRRAPEPTPQPAMADDDLIP